MRVLTMTLFLAAAAVMATTPISAQPPGGGPRKGGQPPRKGEPPAKGDDGGMVERLMAFDKNKDGKLTRDELTDERLARLFDRADANKDGAVTREELTEMAAREPGPGGRGGFGGPPQPGQIMPDFLQRELKLTDDQKKQVEALQKEVDEKLAKILTDAQKKQLKEMRERGPRGFGPPGGGPGRPGGRP